MSGKYETLKLTVFWDLAPYSLVDIDRRFGGYYFIIRAISLDLFSIDVRHQALHLYKARNKIIKSQYNMPVLFYIL
jgi:hypothetical protein